MKSAKSLAIAGTIALLTQIPFLNFALAQQPKNHGGFTVLQFATTSFHGTEAAEIINLKPTVASQTSRQSNFSVVSTGQIADMSSVGNRQTKQQVYIILPLTSDVRYDTGTPGKVKVRSASALDLHFKNGSLLDITDDTGERVCNFEAQKNTSVNRRDFTIRKCKNRIVFDAGLGGSEAAYRDANRSTLVTDENGATCTVSNSKLFTKINKWNSKFKSQTEVAKVLKATPACAALDLSSLKGGAPASRLAAPSQSASGGRATTGRKEFIIPSLEAGRASRGAQ